MAPAYCLKNGNFRITGPTCVCIKAKWPMSVYRVAICAGSAYNNGCKGSSFAQLLLLGLIEDFSTILEQFKMRLLL